VADLTVPPISEEGKMGTVKEDIKGQPLRSEKLAFKPAFSHGDGQRVSIVRESDCLACRKKERKEDEGKKKESSRGGEEG
jgi:hypothetical protein